VSRLVLVATLLLGAGAWAQKMSCEERCTSHDNCSVGCSDEKCMTRCQRRTQQCIQDCTKNFKGVDQKSKSKMQGFCPGPNGKRIRCNQYDAPEGLQDDIQKQLSAPRKDKADDEHDKKYNRAPTPDELEKLQGGK
jgi:hypothetical protein